MNLTISGPGPATEASPVRTSPARTSPVKNRSLGARALNYWAFRKRTDHYGADEPNKRCEKTELTGLEIRLTIDEVMRDLDRNIIGWSDRRAAR